MKDPIIICPHCQGQVHLTESLAAPLIAATRKQFESQLAAKDTEVAQREARVRNQEAQLAQEKNQIQEQVTQQVAEQIQGERLRLTEEAARKARSMVAMEMDNKTRELAELQEVLHSREAKLAQAQMAQADLVKKQRELDDAHRELELTVELRIQQGLGEARSAARREAEESLKLKVMEKDQTIASMQQKIEELKQKSEQGSQQLQGEVLELELEGLLRARFPLDVIDPVPKGEFGGDVLQQVISPSGQSCGLLLWESKRTRNWNDAWLIKLRDDQRAARADVAILVSHTLPKGLETFEVIDGVWVTSPRAAMPVAGLLRYTLLQVGMARQANEGMHSKTEMVYQYLTGPRFRQRVEAIVEAFSIMQEDLDKERKVITRQWARRQEHIDRVMTSTVSMYGDLQGIAGKSLQEIEGLELRALE